MRAASILPFLRATAFVLAIVTFPPTSPSSAETLTFDTLDLPPFGFMSDDGHMVGSAFDIANAIAEEAGLEIDNALVPLTRIIRNLERDRPSCTIVTRSPYSEGFSIPVADIHIPLYGGAIALKSTEINSYNDLNGLVIGLTRGAHLEHAFDKDPNLEKNFLDDDGQVAKMLQMSRIDVAVGSLEAIRYNLTQLGVLSEELGEPLIFVQRDMWLHCAKSMQDGDLFTRLREATERLHKQGVIQAIWSRYE